MSSRDARSEAPSTPGRRAADEAPARDSRPTASILLASFCAVTTVFLVVRDLFVAGPRDTEVWLGFEVTGALARATAPVHWAIFAIGTWAFWTRRPWIWTIAALYATYVAVSHVVWNLVSASGGGWTAALWQLGVFLAPALVLLRLRPGEPAAEGGSRRTAGRRSP